MYPVRRPAAFCRRSGRNTWDGITVAKAAWSGEKAMAADAGAGSARLKNVVQVKNTSKTAFSNIY